MADDSNRNVSVTLKVVPDAGNAAVFKRAGQQVKDYQAAVDKEEQRQHDRSRQRQQERARDHRRAIDQQQRDSVRAAAAQEREEDRAHQRMRARQLERARAARDASEQEARAAELSSRRIEAAHNRVLSGSARLISNTTELVRGLTFLGLSGSASLEKVARGMLMVQGAVDTVRSGLRLAVNARRTIAAAQVAGGASGTIAGAAGPIAAGAAAVGSLGLVGLEVGEMLSGRTGAAGNTTHADPITGQLTYGLQRGPRVTNFIAEKENQLSRLGLTVNGYLPSWMQLPVANGEAVRREVTSEQKSSRMEEQFAYDRERRRIERQTFDAQHGVRMEQAGVVKYGGATAGELAANQGVIAATAAGGSLSTQLATTVPDAAASFRSIRQMAAEQQAQAALTSTGITRQVGTEQQSISQRTAEAQSVINNTGASAETQAAAQRELVQLKQEGVALAQKEGQLRAASIREQASGLQQQQQAYNEIAKSEFTRLQASKEQFALMSTGQQNRLLRDLDRFNNGQSLGPGRVGLRREIALRGAGLISGDNDRLQRDIGNRVPQGAFADTQRNIDNAVHNANRIGKEISDKMGEAFKAGIDAEAIADKLRDEFSQLSDSLISALQDAGDRMIAQIKRAKLMENAKGAGVQ
jgi:hypothetical protein